MIAIIQCEHKGCPKAQLFKDIPQIKEIFIYAYPGIDVVYSASCYTIIKYSAESDSLQLKKIKKSFEEKLGSMKYLNIKDIYPYPDLNALAFKIDVIAEKSEDRTKLSLYEALCKICGISHKQIKEIKVYKINKKHEEIVFLDFSENQVEYARVKQLEKTGVYKIKRPRNKHAFEVNYESEYRNQDTPINKLHEIVFMIPPELVRKMFPDINKQKVQLLHFFTHYLPEFFQEFPGVRKSLKKLDRQVSKERTSKSKKPSKKLSEKYYEKVEGKFKNIQTSKSRDILAAFQRAWINLREMEEKLENDPNNMITQSKRNNAVETYLRLLNKVEEIIKKYKKK